jgi:hypothetical protein
MSPNGKWVTLSLENKYSQFTNPVKKGNAVDGTFLVFKPSKAKPGCVQSLQTKPEFIIWFGPCWKIPNDICLRFEKKNGRAFEIKLANPDWVYNTKNLSLAFTFQKFSIFFTGKYRTIDNVVKNIDKMVTFWPIVVKF